MAVTIKDVAKKAGVSASTVSRTISDHYSISEETKQKVRQVMDELGYTTNKMVEKIKSIGVVFPKSQHDAYENPFYLEAIRGIGFICNQRQYNMNIITGANDYELRSSIRNCNADGYIFLYSDLDDKMIDYIYEQNHLFVLIGKPTRMVNETLCVDTDNIQASIEAVNYLATLGHKKIAYIGTEDTKVFSYDRKIGYVQGMAQNDLPIPEDYIQTMSSSMSHDAQPILDLLKSDHRPTAFIVCDDIFAITLDRYIRQVGLKVPEDISIVSFNNSIFSRLMDPPLTSFDINSMQLGIEAANQLIKHIETPNLYATKIIVPYFLVMRKSCTYINSQGED